MNRTSSVKRTKASTEHRDIAKAWNATNGKPTYIDALTDLISYVDDRARRDERDAIAKPLAEMVVWMEADDPTRKAYVAVLEMLSARARGENDQQPVRGRGR